MAASQFVIAGRVDCDQYARLEAAADYFQARLPSFRVHKEPQPALEWLCYLRRTCLAQGWDLPSDPRGPLVWRLLVQRGGRGLLVGGLSEFLQFAAVYYGLAPPELSPAFARQMAAHTAAEIELDRRQRRQARTALERRLTSVAVLGALSGAAHHFLATLAGGGVLGETVPLRLQLLGDPGHPELAGLRDELQDLASPLLGQVALLPSLREAVRNASVVIIIDPIPNVPPPTPPPATPPPSPPPPPGQSPVSSGSPSPAAAPPAGEGERAGGREVTEPPLRSSPSARRSPPPSGRASSPGGGPAGRGNASMPRDSPEPPTIAVTLSEDRIPADLPPAPRGRAESPRRSGDSRRLSIILEDPDSEEKEEEEMEQIMASRPGSGGRSGGRPGSGGRSGGWSGRAVVDVPAAAAAALERSQELATDAAAMVDGGARLFSVVRDAVTAAAAPSPLVGGSPTDEGVGPVPGQSGARTAAGGVVSAQPPGTASVPPSWQTATDGPTACEACPYGRGMDADRWLEPALTDHDTDVTDQELAELFDRIRAYARAIDATASSHCRVVVAGGRLPCLAATVALLHLPRLSPSNVIALCQPRVNQLRALLAARLGVTPHDVHGLAEWGNPPAGRTWLDLDAATVSRHDGAVRGPPGYRRPLLEVLHQRQRLTEELPRELAERAGSTLLPAGAEVSALPLAVCLADTVRRWWAGADDDGHVVSLGVASEGEFGVPARLVFAAPARLIAGDFRVCRAQPLGNEGAAAVRAAADQMVAWLWRFGVRVSPSGRYCTISSCASSTVSVCASGERVSSDGERPSSGDEKATPPADGERRSPPGEGDGAPAPAQADGAPAPAQADGAPAPAQADGAPALAEGDGAPALAEGDGAPAPADGDPQTPTGGSEPSPSANADQGPTAGDEESQPSADSQQTPSSSAEGERILSSRPSAAEGERTPSSEGVRRPSSAKGERTPSSEGVREPSSANGERTPSAEGERSSAEGARTPSPEGERTLSGSNRRKSLTAEGERDFIPVDGGQQ